ncbi:MAG TPA: hypothetical protein VKA60_21575 [Blastocatellia bacterium]|nr:hypothetical protein [Blastocatellia bacterium]
MNKINTGATGRSNRLAVIAITILLALTFAVYRAIRRAPKSSPPAAPSAGVPRGGFPEMANKPMPKEVVYKGCPPEGDGGDPALNRLKNRVDEADQYFNVPLDSVVQLPYPKTIERKDRNKWSAADTEAIARYEGTPIVVEGFLARSKKEAEESCNCHGTQDDQVDFHVWLVKNANDERTNALVVEVSPRLRSKHPAWTTDALGRIARNDQRVRISGWLMMDPEHPDQIGKTRGTIWEIHPITKIEVEQNGGWVSLDSLTR